GPNDRPWRMGKTIDNTFTSFNGQWQEVRIPLKALAEMGAWDGAWFNPQGLFDWTNIDKLEIVAEHHPLTGITFCYDDIKIEGEDIEEEIITSVKPSKTIKIYPNPFTEGVTIDYKPETTQTDVLIYNQLGVLIRQFSQSTFVGEKATLHWDGTTENGLRAGAGIYLIRVKSGDTVQIEKVLAR
ncbi:MAG TPA: T9SS type A sorting domain-containing protein, partial [Cyclobacteriaceae bacterium]|nr:T9SS type A sorting domain-containing protein [Cyclobacteriaceae bacterium]